MNRDVRALQLIQYMILCDVVDICETHGLRYYLIAGTLLGAVRHGGFIPWDDDVDIAMYREDLSRLEHIIATRHSDKYSVQNCWTDGRFTRFITKVRLRGTRMVEADDTPSLAEEFSGIWIDIFPIDYVRTTGLALRLTDIKLRFLSALAVAKHLDIEKRNTTKVKRLLYRVLRLVVRRVSHAWIAQAFVNACTSSPKDHSPYSTIFMSAYGCRRETVPNGVYGDGRTVVFEGRRFRAPSGYEQLLSRIYGNYLELPPEGRRVSHHRIEEINFGRYGDHGS